MPIVFDPANIAYFSAPKCACSSLKVYFHRLSAGEPWKKSRAAGEPLRLHQKYPSQHFVKVDHAAFADYARIAVVRAPVARIKSCYTNKIIEENFLTKTPEMRAQVKAKGLPETPDIDTFVANLDAYRNICGPIKRHSQPLTFWLGKDPSYFDALFDMSQLADLRAYVAARTPDDLGLQKIKIPHKNKTEVKVASVEMSAKSIATLKDRFKEDLSVFGHLFPKT